MKGNIGKYCTYGTYYQDSVGKIKDEGKEWFVISSINGGWVSTYRKVSTNIFETEKEAHTWIKKQNYQYDSR